MIVTRDDKLRTTRTNEGGYVLGVAIQVVLVLLILGMLVFLASRFRLRVDLTSEQYYTLTESTKRVLGGLEDRLHIEAYFSPDEQLTGQLADARRTFRNVLDEFVQNSRGRVSIQFLDPNSDNDLREKATRLGIKPQNFSSREDRSLSYKELWQGLRLRYGGAKQKVIEFVQPAIAPFQYEMQLTPQIKALTVDKRPKIGLVATASRAANPGGGPADFMRITQFPQISDRYDIKRHPLDNGELIPDEFGTLLLIRPQQLTDRQKFVLDQFLMRGGQLVVFADTDEFSIGQQRAFNRSVIVVDEKDSKTNFYEQLESYGIKVGANVLLDDAQQAAEGFQRVVQMGNGMRIPQTLYYPYWFHAVDRDWSEVAEELAKDKDGTVDEALAASYAKAFEAGVHESLDGVPTPGMFWPCEVSLAEILPDGVSGDVLLRTSPLALGESAPQHLNPFGRARDPQQQQADYAKFYNGIKGRLASEPRQQFGLMAEVRGEFTSFFDGKDIPLSPAAEKAAEAKKQREAEAAEKAAAEGETGTDDTGTDDTETVGPELPDTPEPAIEEVQDPDPVLAAAEPGRLVVVGDATFLRDDLVTGQYRQLGGPVSLRGPRFFLNLLDWLAEDRDLFELRNKISTDRTLRLLSDDEKSGNLQRFNERVRNKQRLVRTINIVLPCALLLGFGLIVFVRRRVAKREFLESLRS